MRACLSGASKISSQRRLPDGIRLHSMAVHDYVCIRNGTRRLRAAEVGAKIAGDAGKSSSFSWSRCLLHRAIFGRVAMTLCSFREEGSAYPKG